MSKTKKRVIAWVACLALAAGSVAMLSACGASQAEEAEQPVDTRVLVATSTPQIGDIVVQGEFIGTVEPDQQLTVYPKAAGEVLAVNFAVGDVVQAGDVLIQIDSKTLQQNIAKTEVALSLGEQKAQLGVAMAEKGLETAKENVESGDNSALMQAENGVKTAEAAVKTAENGLELAEQGLMTARRSLREHRELDEYDYDVEKRPYSGGLTYDDMEVKLKDAVAQAENAVERAQIGLQQAKDGLAQAKSGLSAAQKQTDQGFDSAEDEIELARLNANLTESKMSLDILRDDLKNYTVTAAIGGVVEQCNVSQYDMVSQQVPLFVISNKDIMAITFAVSETTVASMRVGDAVTVDKNGRTFPATISEISTMVDARTGLYPVKALVENAPVTLFSGSTVKIYAATEKAQNDLLIPIDALYYDKTQPYVYVAQSGFAKKVLVETGISDETHIQVLSGLSTSDEVVSTWSPGLADGAEIVLAGDVQTGAEGEPAPESEAAATDNVSAESEASAPEPSLSEEGNA